MVLSFDPHPQRLLAPKTAPPLLQTPDQKHELLRDLGVDVVVRFPFTHQLAALTPEEFVRGALCPHGIREIHVGVGFRFGRDRSGDFHTLRALGRQLGFEVHEVSPVALRGALVSSTRVRRLVAHGRVALAGRLLGRPYEIRGRVVHGAGRGATLGFPTANLAPENDLIPAGGVYAGTARVDSGSVPCVVNIGFRPTVEERRSRRLTVEPHLLGYSADLYDQPIALRFCLRLRSEEKFASAELLQAQVGRDIALTRKYFSRLPANLSV
jgi:riboflavin kinase/FMN adenylyltransferase